MTGGAYIITADGVILLAVVFLVIGSLVGWVAGHADGKSKAEPFQADARRWRHWREHWYRLAGQQVARAAGMDASVTYVQTPAELDRVTDAAIAAQRYETKS